MKTNLDNEHTVIELREFMESNGLNPPLPDSARLTEARGEKIYARAIEMANTPQTVEIPSITTSVFTPSKWRSQTKWVLAACLAGAVAVGVGAHLSVESASLSSEMMLAGIAPLQIPGADLTNITHAPSAKAALQAAQQIAASAGQAGQGDIQFISLIDHILEIESLDADARQRIGLQSNEFWIAPDGSGLAQTIYGPMVDINDFNQLNFTEPIVGEAAEYVLKAPTEFDLRHGSQAFTPWVTAELSRDTSQLRNQLLARSDCGNSEQCLLFAITSLYRTNLIPDDLAASLWELASTSPALHSLGETTDRIGRPALAFAYEAFPGTGVDNFYLLLVSPENGRLIGWEEVAVNDPTHHITEPTVIGFTIWQDARFVQNLGDRP